jgi:hypothetical protein
VHQTLKDTPYHLTYGQHARVGISNLPVEPSVLANLTTEAGLQDVYLQMWAGMIHDENQALSLQALVTTPYSNTLAAVAASVGNLHQVAESVTTVNNAVAGSSILSQKKQSDKSMRSTDKLQCQTKQAKEVALNDALTVKNISPVNINGVPPALAEAWDNQSLLKSPGATEVELTLKVLHFQSSAVEKSDGLDEVSNHWIELIRDRKIPVVKVEIQKAKIGEFSPIMRCINSKDIRNPANFAACILRKVQLGLFEVLDTNSTNKVEEDLEWDGDDGLRGNWNMYYKYPSDEYIASYLSSLEIESENTEYHKFSPRCLTLWNKAASNVAKKAESVKKRVKKTSATCVLKLGDVVLVPLDDVDCTKVDTANIAGVVVSMSKDKSTCRVAVKEGVFHCSYMYHSLRSVPPASNDRKLMDLEDAFINWRGLPRITEREAARFISSVGGQGMVKCNCRRNCLSNICACKKTGGLCSS